MAKYETNPLKIREKNIQAIKDGLNLDHFSELEQKVAIQIIQACGDLELLESIRFSEGVIEKALEILGDDFDLLCDAENVICGVRQKYLKEEPICLIKKASVISQAKTNKNTRSMTAVDNWKPYLSGSIILIGNEPTALFRLLEVLAETDEDDRPALIIALPAGFIGAQESKKKLWDKHEKLGIPCITLLGTKGGSDAAAAVINSLLRLKAGV
ncbi:MAG TPA: precorrin-8X methylmutase [Leucothrix sp.]|nr:precorrin-8X methylmutase [Leucothrix sp.]